jgi:ABC-type phosphate/phosphonate transport system substrate-binding protein
MLQGMFRDVQPAMVQAMSRPLRDLIQKQTGLTGDVEILADAYALSERLQAKRFQLGVFHGYEYAWVRKQNPDLMPIAVTVPPGKKLQACIIVRKDHDAKALADLGEEPIIVPKGTKAHCLLYLDRERAKLGKNSLKTKTKPPLTTEETLESIVAGDTVAALVDVGALAGFQSLQPGAFKQLRILCQSESFPQTVIVSNKGSLDEATAKKIRTLLTTAHSSPAGKPLLMLWNLKGFEEVPADYTAQLDAIAKAYPAPPRPSPVVTPTVGMKPEDD